MVYVHARLHHRINICSSDLLPQSCFPAPHCISHQSANGCPSHMEHRGDLICYLMIWKVNTSRAVLQCHQEKQIGTYWNVGRHFCQESSKHSFPCEQFDRRLKKARYQGKTSENEASPRWCGARERTGVNFRSGSHIKL